MSHKIRDVGAAKLIGRYSDSIEVEAGLSWLYSSGTPGILATGEVPEGIEAQSRVAWGHIMQMLERAGMTVNDLVKVTATLINADDISGYVKVRGEFLGDVRPAMMLQVMTQLIRPDVLVEVEIIAAKK